MKRIPGAGKTAWRRANGWLLSNPLPAFILVAIVSAWAVGVAYEAGKDGQAAANKANDAIETSNRERAARVQVSGEINRYVCQENNKQDRILAGLIGVSLGGQASFGEGIPPELLTEFDTAVIDSIQRIQKVSGQSSPEDFQAAFKRAQAQLLHDTPCAELVNAFTAASDTEDYKAIRRFLRALDRKEREAADAVAPAP